MIIVLCLCKGLLCYNHFMIISLIVAMARNRVIGNAGKIPWKLPADMKRFRALTMGKPVVMGRKTFESIGKPLPGRTNIVMTRDPSLRAEGCRVVSSCEEAIAAAADAGKVMIIGGEEIYKEFLSIAHRINLTVIDVELQGDALFPEVNLAEWHEVNREKHGSDEKNPCAYTFVTLEKK